jgi:large subunit ribosomal protein L1
MPNFKRSKKYRANVAILEKAFTEYNSKVFTVSQAVKTLLQFEKSKFKEGETLELHFNLHIDSTKSDQLVRGSVVLPHGTGKDVKIAAFVSSDNLDLMKKLGCYKYGNDDLIDEIKNTGKLDFDVAIAQPEIMKKLAVIARTLGTAGLMPNPKTGTVGDNLEDMITLIKAGKVDYKNDKSGNIHFSVGKLNSKFDEEKLIKNIEQGVDSVEKNKPDGVKRKYINTIHLSGTMTPSIQIR